MPGTARTHGGGEAVGTPSIVWFRQDLRLGDNPALAAACARGPVLPVFILDDEAEGRWPHGGASRWWLHHSLAALKASLKSRGSDLLFRIGRSEEILEALAEQTGASGVYWNDRYEPCARAQGQRVRERLEGRGLAVQSHPSHLLFEPEQVRNRQGGPFQVFGPFWRACVSRDVAAPKPAPRSLEAPRPWPDGPALGDLGLLPSIPWDAEIAATWTPGEEAGLKRLRAFLRKVDAYEADRDKLGEEGTSSLSPHLRFGEVSPRQVWEGIRRLGAPSGVFPPGPGARKFLAELGWREFAYHLLHHFPDTPEQPLREKFRAFPWAEDPDGRLFRAWSRGNTGYPLVDAGMRQLWRTGWMPNRVRMIAASFLVKHLRLPWQQGSRWFWDTLVDADLASNTLGWQWIAGSGADASPYFRIFSPVLQAEKFDSDGSYVKRWVPELSALPKPFLHRPWEAPLDVLHGARVRLGETYPERVVEHAAARDAALAAYRSLAAP